MGVAKRVSSYLALASLLICVLGLEVFSQTIASGGPGKDAQWATAGKQAVGTSASLESKVWFTLAQGVMSEVYYPDVTVANVHLLQFFVFDTTTKKLETEQDDAIHDIRVLRPDSLTFQQINEAKSGKWKITKTYVTDSKRDAVVIDVTFEPKDPTLTLYAHYDPSLGNSGLHDDAVSNYRMDVGQPALISEDKKERRASALVFSSAVREQLSGFAGVNSGIEQLRKTGTTLVLFSEAFNGNVVQTVRIANPRRFTTVLAFGTSGPDAALAANRSLETGFERIRNEYEEGWSNYVRSLPKVAPRFQPQFNMAAMQLRTLEDKTARGANIASLTVPWGGGENANENNVGGYHLIWSRDLYQVFTAYMALGDKAAAERALGFLLKVQQKPDGSFPQNSWLDGRPFWGSLQMDEVAYPLIMAWQLGQFDKATYENHLKKAADFIVKNGPATPQERWEEEAGYSPSTIAAEIAGLVCVADIAKRNGDTASAARFLATADEWQRNIDKWTATRTGKYGDGNYYLRITQNGKPDAGEKIELNNGAGIFDERQIIDAGFLELVRLGIKPADDPLIARSIKVVDQVIKVATPNGDGFYRYNNDGYGEMDDGRRWNWDGKYTGKGRLWVLLSGERGQYEIAQCGLKSTRTERNGRFGDRKHCLSRAQTRLANIAGFANGGLMIPEQVWDRPDLKSPDRQFVPDLKFGEGTGSATPLAWSMAQFIRLAVNLKSGRNLDMPQVVYDRYVAPGSGKSN